MSNNKKSLSDRIYSAALQDGSVDLFAGIALTFLGIGWLIDQFVFSAIIPALIVPVYAPFRKKFIEPRIGHVEFGEERRGQIKVAHIVLIGIGCFVLMLGVGVYFADGGGASNDWLRTVMPALPAVLLGIGGIVSAAMFSIHRLAFYGIVLIVAGFTGAAFNLEPGWSLLAGGIVTLVSGTSILMWFMSTFPPLKSEVK